jgi:site-specific DNA recombinase
MKKNQNFRISLYVRVSSEEQAENPEGSIKNQEQRLREAVEWRNKNSHFGEIVGVYVDAGISAKDMNRPRLQDMLRSIRHKETDLVMVTELSRLSRNNRDFLSMWDMLHDHGCSFMSLREDFDTTTAAGEMLLFQIMNFAQFERKQTSERVTANILARASRGLYNGGPVPLGYKLIPERHGYLAIDEEQAATIKVIFDTFLREGSLTATARWLNEKGYSAKKLMEGGGGKSRLGYFYIDNLHKILRNKAYVGIKCYIQKGELKEAPAVWEAIIDPVTFERVGDLLSKNKSKLKPVRENTRHCYILSGISFCKTCGDSLPGKTATGRSSRFFYYEHGWATKRNAGLSKKLLSCEPKRILANKIEPLIWDEVIRFLTSPRMLKEMKEGIEKLNQGNASLKERERLQAKISGLNSQLEALTERLSFLPKSVSAAPFFKQMEKLEIMKKDFEQKLQSDEGSARPPSLRFVTQETFTDFAKYWEKFLLTANDEMKKKIVQKFVRRVEVGKDEVNIQWLVDEEHYQNELNLRSNSPVFGENQKKNMVGGSYN